MYLIYIYSETVKITEEAEYEDESDTVDIHNDTL